MTTLHELIYRTEAASKRIFHHHLHVAGVPQGLLLAFVPHPDNPKDGPYRTAVVFIDVITREVVMNLD